MAVPAAHYLQPWVAGPPYKALAAQQYFEDVVAGPATVGVVQVGVWRVAECRARGRAAAGAEPLMREAARRCVLELDRRPGSRITGRHDRGREDAAGRSRRRVLRRSGAATTPPQCGRDNAAGRRRDVVAQARARVATSGDSR